MISHDRNADQPYEYLSCNDFLARIVFSFFFWGGGGGFDDKNNYLEKNVDKEDDWFLSIRLKSHCLKILRHIWYAKLMHSHDSFEAAKQRLSPIFQNSSFSRLMQPSSIDMPWKSSNMAKTQYKGAFITLSSPIQHRARGVAILKWR